MKKTAVILLNLGGPASLKEVRSFLFKLFYDKAIIRLPNPFRWAIAKLISYRREKIAKEIYSKIGGSSPILSETIMQKNALEKRLKNNDTKIFISMRYSSPNSKDTAKKIMEYKPDQIILLPLYPQFSTTTTESSIKDMEREITKIGLENLVKKICCYPSNKGFIEAHIDNIKKIIKEKKPTNYRILFSAHSLPEKIIKDGDPYKWQIEKTVGDIVKSLKIKDLDYKITYQSKVTPVKWIGPDTESEIKAASKEKESVIVVPIAFVSEHSETLVELDIEYKEIADKESLQYIRVPTLGIHEKYIDALAKMIESFANEEKSLVSSDKKSRICPSEFNKCICKDFYG